MGIDKNLKTHQSRKDDESDKSAVFKVIKLDSGLQMDLANFGPTSFPSPAPRSK